MVAGCTLSETVLAGFRGAVFRRLLAEKRGPCWPGRLSSSSVATSTAVFALGTADPAKHERLVRNGLNWIVSDINEDGGWGDSPESPSNLTATLLCRSALSLDGGKAGDCADAAGRADGWLDVHAGGHGPAEIREAVFGRYGADRTFAAPILTMCALAAARRGEKWDWDGIPQLPFEMSVLPGRLLRLLRLTVVSYALPALIAIGLVRHRQYPCRNPALRMFRDLLIPAALRKAERMQPSNGGYEEAPPLTAFVAMSLVAAGYSRSPVVKKGVDFLCRSVRDDGSWAIDSNLVTWLTCLSVRTLAGDGGASIGSDDKDEICRWLLRQQHTVRHPLSMGAPGGWSWTDLPGGMPDADDTSGVLAALRIVGVSNAAVPDAACRGVEWLLNLQNADGGMPTFSRGWGKLPFDRSCPDITAHAMEALSCWEPELPERLRCRVQGSLRRMLRYLADAQAESGSWDALWFGNQYSPEGTNRTYATARVIMALESVAAEDLSGVHGLAAAGKRWLRSAQLADGGWCGGSGGEPSIEETAMAVAAIRDPQDPAVEKGIEWLARRTKSGLEFAPAPIGLYFASLWYSEELYPMIFTALALARCNSGRP
jgi:squalene-hopene/tetraprenyl-beta-curcumene cyclase